MSNKLLIIDDEPLMRDITSEVAKMLGLDVTTASSCSEGFELYQAARNSGNPYRAILTDNDTGNGLSGLDLIVKVNNLEKEDHKNPNKTRIILMSGYDRFDDAMDKGAIAFIQKPFKIEAIQELLRYAMPEQNYEDN